MAAISGIIFKVTCRSEIPSAMFLDNTILLTMDHSDITHSEILQYLKYQQLIRFSIKNITSEAPWFFFCNKNKDNEYYQLIEYKNLNDFLLIRDSKLNQKTYLPLKQKIYDSLNWIDHGHKIIPLDYNFQDWDSTSVTNNVYLTRYGGPEVTTKFLSSRMKDFSIFDKVFAEQIWNSI